MRIIDAHIHYFQDPHFDLLAGLAGHENTEAHLREVYARHGIRHSIVMGNRTLDLSTHQYPDFLSYCVGLDSTYQWAQDLPGAYDRVEAHLKQEKCVGIKIYPGYNPFSADDPVNFPLFELAMAYKKPVAVHTGATAGTRAQLKLAHPLTLDAAATAFPQVQFIMCHFGNPWVVDAAAVLSKNPNVSADLSGMLEGTLDMAAFFREREGYVHHLQTWLQYLGAYDRIMYGTDWPLVNIPNYIEFVSHLIPTRYHEQVFFDNANRIYGLGLE